MTNELPTPVRRAAAAIAAVAALSLAPCKLSFAGIGLDECRAVAGTYVTAVTDVEGVFASRGLMTFTADGVFLMSDSAQAGLPGVYDPFGSAQGAWGCLRTEGDKLEISAVGLNFVLPGEGRPVVFGRVDYRATLVVKTGMLSGSAELSFTTQGDLEAADPIDEPGPVLEKFHFEGKRVDARGD